MLLKVDFIGHANHMIVTALFEECNIDIESQNV